MKKFSAVITVNLTVQKSLEDFEGIGRTSRACNIQFDNKIIIEMSSCSEGGKYQTARLLNAWKQKIQRWDKYIGELFEDNCGENFHGYQAHHRITNLKLKVENCLN